jgi:dolichyl-phosphate beta-glucosyltransferase
VPDTRTDPRVAANADPLALSVIVPMYKEAARIADTLRDLVDTLDHGAGVLTGQQSAEIILVDDGSPDATIRVVTPFLTEARRGHLARVALVRHPVNRGKGAAVRTGLAAARGAWRLMMDADNAAKVDQLARLWPHATPAATPIPAMVCGSRNTPDARVRARPFRKVSGILFRLALSALRLNLLRDTQCGFKLYRKDAADLIVAQGREDRFAFDLEHLLLAKRLGRLAEVGIAWEHKDGGTVSPVRDGLKMLREAARIRLRFLKEKISPIQPTSQIEPKPAVPVAESTVALPARDETLPATLPR